MTIKRFAWSALAACSLAGCGISDSSIRVLNAASLNEGCGLVEDGYVKKGQLNLAVVSDADREASWPFYVESNLQDTRAGGSGDELNDFIADRIDLSYTLEPAVGTLQPASVPVYAVLRVNSAEGSNMSIPLLPAQALRELRALGIGEDGVILNVTFQIHGKTAGGMVVSSSPVMYPIEVFSVAPPPCPTGQVLEVHTCNSPLNPRYACVTQPTTP